MVVVFLSDFLLHQMTGETADNSQNIVLNPSLLLSV